MSYFYFSSHDSHYNTLVGELYVSPYEGMLDEMLHRVAKKASVEKFSEEWSQLEELVNDCMSDPDWESCSDYDIYLEWVALVQSQAS